MKKTKAPLYRKYNKLAVGFHRNQPGGEYCRDRNSKAMNRFEGSRKAMGRTREGYDYTPLFKFLLQKVGKEWDAVFSEAVARLDKQSPIFWLVNLHFDARSPAVVRLGESSYYSTLVVENGVLRIADEHVQPPSKNCTCCTHTFNGVAY